MALSSGTKLGPYEILAPIGAGGMGEVYRARDTRLDRTVAIKILPAHLSDNPEAKQRFDREARAISSLNHHNICTLYDVGHQDGNDYLLVSEKSIVLSWAVLKWVCSVRPIWRCIHFGLSINSLLSSPSAVPTGV